MTSVLYEKEICGKGNNNTLRNFAPQEADELFNIARLMNSGFNFRRSKPAAQFNESFLGLTYSDRQLVLFVDDAVIMASAKAEASAEAEVKRKKADKKPRQAWDVFWEAYKGFLFSPMLVNLVAEVAIQIIRGYQKAKQDGVNISLVPKSRVGLFQLPPGHPRDGVLYAGHPASPRTYIPLADFHRFTFEHKFSEIISILMHLGAKTIEVEHVTGWSSDFAAKLSVAIPNASGGANATSKSSDQRRLLFRANLSPRHVPSMPDKLVWFPSEATWKPIVDGRLQFGLDDFVLSLHYKDDYGINGSLKSKVQKAGLELGGSFQDHQSTTWRIQGQFGEPASSSDRW